MDVSDSNHEPSSRHPRTWTDFSYLRWSGVENPNSKLGKVGLEKFLAKNNLPHSKIIKEFPSADAIDLDGLPDYFVLKPTSLWSGAGVMLLHKISGIGYYYDAKSRRAISKEDIKDYAKKIEKSSSVKTEFMIEDRILDEDPAVLIPLDYKIFTFNGHSKFILQVDRNHATPKMSFFDGNFTPINDDRVVIPEERRERTQGEHRIPKHADSMLKMARDITVTLKAPFISVDCYSSSTGAVFGELTHTPGGPWYGTLYRFSETFDLELGQEWAEACNRLGIEIQPIKSPYEIKHNGRTIRTVL